MSNRNVLLTLASILILINPVKAIETETLQKFRALTFNIWNCGVHVNNGVDKIVKHVKLVNPDVVAFEEVQSELCYLLLAYHLGQEWQGFHHSFMDASGYIDTAIFSKWTIYKESQAEFTMGIGLKIAYPFQEINDSEQHATTNDDVEDSSLSHVEYKTVRETLLDSYCGKEGSAPGYVNISLWVVHLDWHAYGPYAACNMLCTEQAQIMAGEYYLGDGTEDPEGRIQNIRRLLANRDFEQAVAKSENEPLILMGDFNTPSHLDWTDSTKGLHCNWSFPWPGTKILIDETGLKDSFRVKHPDASKEPGTTWSTVTPFKDNGPGYTIPEPQDRIDFILYRSERLSVIDSQKYAGSEVIYPKPDHAGNDWPSDHFAVFTDFKFR